MTGKAMEMGVFYGLQIRLQRFNSASHLQLKPRFDWGFYFYGFGVSGGTPKRIRRIRSRNFVGGYRLLA